MFSHTSGLAESDPAKSRFAEFINIILLFLKYTIFICIRQNLITNYSIFTTLINIFMTPINIRIGAFSLINLSDSKISNEI